VRPSSKRDKKKAKRKADPGRRVYQEILNSNNFANHGIAGAIEAMSNTSISSLADDDVSPKGTVPGRPGDSPSAESPSTSEYFNVGTEGGVKLEEKGENK
jgi:hypothetical protein